MLFVHQISYLKNLVWAFEKVLFNIMRHQVRAVVNLYIQNIYVQAAADIAYTFCIKLAASGNGFKTTNQHAVRS